MHTTVASVNQSFLDEIKANAFPICRFQTLHGESRLAYYIGPRSGNHRVIVCVQPPQSRCPDGRWEVRDYPVDDMSRLVIEPPADADIVQDDESVHQHRDSSE